MGVGVTKGFLNPNRTLNLLSNLTRGPVVMLVQGEGFRNNLGGALRVSLFNPSKTPFVLPCPISPFKDPLLYSQ